MPILFLDTRRRTHYRWGAMEKTAAQLRAELAAIEETYRDAITKRDQQELAPEAISPRTKLPVDHPESQAVERILYETGHSLCGQPTPAATIKNLLEEKPKQ